MTTRLIYGMHSSVITSSINSAKVFCLLISPCINTAQRITSNINPFPEGACRHE